jgi:hypothetical protein
LGRDLADHVFEALEVGFSRLQAGFCFVLARMQAGNSGGFFQNAAAVFRLRIDDFADLPLTDEGRRARAGGSVCKEQLHVARADFAAVDAIGRTRLALDAAGDFEHVGIVELGRGLAVGVIDHDHDFGGIARRAVRGAREDHLIHVLRAHRLGGAFAHRPAQRLDDVGLAAAVGADDAGEPRFDHELGGLYERLEADKL